MICSHITAHPHTASLTHRTMSRQPDLFHCIPHRSPIPSGIVALIGGITADRPIFGLYKDNREIFIYAPEADHLKEEIDEEDEFYEYKIIEQNRKVFDFYLSMIVCFFISISVSILISFFLASLSYSHKFILERRGPHS